MNLDQHAKTYLIEILKDQFETDDVNLAIRKCEDRFKSEYGHEIKRYGELKALTNWLGGLAINIDYTNDQIMQRAVEWGSVSEDYTEIQAYKILSSWFHLMANKLGQLFRGYRIPKGVA